MISSSSLASSDAAFTLNTQTNLQTRAVHTVILGGGLGDPSLDSPKPPQTLNTTYLCCSHLCDIVLLCMCACMCSESWISCIHNTYIIRVWIRYSVQSHHHSAISDRLQGDHLKEGESDIKYVGKGMVQMEKSDGHWWKKEGGIKNTSLWTQLQHLTNHI